MRKPLLWGVAADTVGTIAPRRRQLPLFRERAPAFRPEVNRVVGSALLSHPRVRLVGVERPGRWVNTPEAECRPRARGS